MRICDLRVGARAWAALCACNGARIAAVLAWISVPAWLSIPAIGHGQSATNSLTLGQPEVHTLAASTIAVPVEHSFAISNTGTYHVKLTDLGAALQPPSTPAPLASVAMQITSGASVVGPSGGLSGAGTLDFNAAAAGTYTLHVVGTPGSQPGSGPIAIQVTDNTGAVIETYSDTLTLPSGNLPNGEVGLDEGGITVPATGTYQLSLNDLKLPQALTTVTVALFQEGGALLAALPDSSNAYTTSVSLQAGVNYHVIAIGVPNSTNSSGLFSVTLGTASAAPVYARTLPLGSTAHVGSPALTAGSDSFVVADLSFPAALTQINAALMLNGQPVVQLSAAGSQSFTATAATYQIYAYGAAAANGGSYVAQVTAGGTNVFSSAQAVTSVGSTLGAFTYNATIPTAGPYLASVTDFQFPAVFSSLGMEVVQGSAALATPMTSAGSQTVNAAAGPISVLVFAQPHTGAGLFGVQLGASGSPNPLIDSTQAVGATFTEWDLTISTAGNIQVSVDDLAWPAAFTNLDVVVTQGNNQVGSVFGKGKFVFPATPGKYFVNIVAQPDATANAGTYVLTANTAPPSPVVTLSANPTHVSAGGVSTLTWSTQNATSCTASGGWTGSQAVGNQNQASTGAINATATFTLTCTGDGGSTTASATVTVDPPSSSGGHGGGEVDEFVIAILSLLWMRNARRSLRG